MNIQQAISKTTEKLICFSSCARLDAELLVADCCNKSRTECFAYPEYELAPDQIALLERNIERYIQGEPIAYILGHKEFWSLDFTVTRDTLIPRPETEHLVEWILDHFNHAKKLKIADLGVGSGAIAVALAYERPNWIIHVTDHSIAALNVAKHNARKHRLSNIHFYHGDWCHALPDKNYNIIVSNPPYLTEQDMHLKHLKFEPKSAFLAGKDGLDAIRIIIQQSKNYLAPGGYLVLEHGMGQGKTILALLKQANYYDYEDHNDLAGIDRFVTAASGGYE